MFPDKDISAGFDVQMLVYEIMKLNRDINIMGGKTMKDFGANEEIIHKIMESFSPARPGYPRTTSKEDWTNVMIKVMNGEYMLK